MNPDPKKPVGTALTLRGTIDTLNSHPLFSHLNMKKAKRQKAASAGLDAKVAFRVDYPYGCPIVTGTPSFHPQQPSSPNDSIPAPPLSEPDQTTWKTLLQVNPLFVILKGIVEIHHPCEDDEESVPRAQLAHPHVFGAYELDPADSTNPVPYRFSATAGFRTVVCWRAVVEDSERLRPRKLRNSSVLIRKYKQFLEGVWEPIPTPCANDAWAYHLFRTFGDDYTDFAGAANTLQASILVLSRDVIDELAARDPRLWQQLASSHFDQFQATTKLSEAINNPWILLTDDDVAAALSLRAKRREKQAARRKETEDRSNEARRRRTKGPRKQLGDAEARKIASMVRVLQLCGDGGLPCLVPIGFYKPLRCWDLYLNLRVCYRASFSRLSCGTTPHPPEMNFGGPLLTYVPLLGKSPASYSQQATENQELYDPVETLLMTRGRYKVSLQLGGWTRCLTQAMVSAYTGYLQNTLHQEYCLEHRLLSAERGTWDAGDLQTHWLSVKKAFHGGAALYSTDDWPPRKDFFFLVPNAGTAGR